MKSVLVYANFLLLHIVALKFLNDNNCIFLPHWRNLYPYSNSDIVRDEAKFAGI